MKQAHWGLSSSYTFLEDPKTKAIWPASASVETELPLESSTPLLKLVFREHLTIAQLIADNHDDDDGGGGGGSSASGEVEMKMGGGGGGGGGGERKRSDEQSNIAARALLGWLLMIYFYFFYSLSLSLETESETLFLGIFFLVFFVCTTDLHNPSLFHPHQLEKIYRNDARREDVSDLFFVLFTPPSLKSTSL